MAPAPTICVSSPLMCAAGSRPTAPAVIVIAGVPADRPVVVAAVNEAGRERGLKAGRLVGVAAKALGGGGGGKDDVAQGGGHVRRRSATRCGAVEQAIRVAWRAARAVCRRLGQGMRHGVRRCRRRFRPHRRGPQRSLGDAGHAGGDRPARPGRPRPARRDRRRARGVEVVVGLPTSLSGREGRAAEPARDFATRISPRLAPTPGAAVRRAADHGHRPARPAGQRGQGQEAARRRGPGGGHRAAPGGAGRRASHRQAAGEVRRPTRGERGAAGGPEESRAAGPPGEPKIARMIYNRIRARTSLRLDTSACAHGRRTLRMSEKDTNMRSPYNTYLSPGRRPVPSRIPGRRRRPCPSNQTEVIGFGVLQPIRSIESRNSLTKRVSL